MKKIVFLSVIAVIAIRTNAMETSPIKVMTGMEQSKEIYQPQSLKYLATLKLPAKSLENRPYFKDHANRILASIIKGLHRKKKKTDKEYQSGLAIIANLLDAGTDPNYFYPKWRMPILNNALQCSKVYSEWQPITNIADQRFEIIELLLKKGANPNLKTAAMPQPFLFHVKKHKYLSWLFLHYDADPNTFDQGNTLLCDLAVYTNGEPVELVKHLLEHGADPRLRNADHETALSLARKYNNHYIIPLLEEAMPKKLV